MQERETSFKTWEFYMKPMFLFAVTELGSIFCQNCDSNVYSVFLLLIHMG